jgi:hypothetical protein
VHTVYCSFYRGAQDLTNSARSIYAPNGIAEGTRLAHRNGPGQDWIHPTFENQTNQSKNAIMANGVPRRSFVDVSISRSATDHAEAWSAEDAATEIFHRNASPAVVAADNFNEVGGQLRCGHSGIGNHPHGLQVRWLMFVRAAGSPDAFDGYRRTTRTVITEL